MGDLYGRFVWEILVGDFGGRFIWEIYMGEFGERFGWEVSFGSAKMHISLSTHLLPVCCETSGGKKTFGSTQCVSIRVTMTRSLGKP